MLPRARHEHLLRQIELYGSVRASEVAGELGVTQVTIRRDISHLAAQRLVHQVHGGAVRVPHRDAKPRAARTLIGVVVPSATFYYPDVVAGMESVAKQFGVRIVLGISRYQPYTERVQVERLLALGVKGVVLTPTLDGVDGEDGLAEWLQSIPVPVVVMERSFDASRAIREFDSVRTDHRHGALLAMDHFVRLGHRAVTLAINVNTPTAPLIQAGYDEAVKQLGLTSAMVRTLTSDAEESETLTRDVERLVNELDTCRPHAVLAHSDRQATLIVEIAQLNGFRVPDDLAIIAYDDVIARHAAVPLTAVTPPRQELGREALRLIDHRLRVAQNPTPPRHEQLVPRLTVRDSCGSYVEGRSAT